MVKADDTRGPVVLLATTAAEVIQQRDALQARLNEADGVISAAQDMMSLWNNLKIKGLPRAKRNTAIEETREKLIRLGFAYTRKYLPEPQST
jgi:hypothetical protein